MSKLFAEYLMNTKEIDRDVLSSVFDNAFVFGRYFKCKKVYEFRVLDFYGYANDPFSPFFYNVKIEEGDLLRMLAVDTYSEDEKNELYYHRLLTEVEQQDLDDDVYYGISILQYFFHISKQTLTEIKRQKHLYDLYKVDSSKYMLKKRVLHSNGGRKLGSISTITDVDIQNMENAEAIIENCVAHDWYNEFMDLHRVLLRFRKTELTLTGAKWKFYILRYKWKIDNHYKERDKEYEKKLIEKNKEYGIFEKLEF